jgi:hypothetical protein
MHALARACCHLLAGVALACPLALWPRPTVGEEIGTEQPSLTESQRAVLIAYRTARAQFERQHRAYWNRVAAKRDARRAKRILGLAYTADDYVASYPPRYTGPELPADIAKLLAPVTPVPAARSLPTVADWLAQAKAQFGFVPTPTTELEFKRRYAREALAVGLTKDQIVRIYALETGGQGTYDTQAGINPVTRQGHPISSALGYAQLLQSNSASELVNHGDHFVKRLLAMAAAPGTSREAAETLRAKAAVLRRMLRAVGSVPDDWNHYVRFAATPAGLAIHTLNLDADVGPWLQVGKLRGLLDAALREGHPPLSGAEVELLNQAGPRTGLEMMLPVAQGMPTSNFFSESGYYSNGIVRDKTARELLRALSDRMEVNVKKPGAVEFARAFDELARN